MTMTMRSRAYAPIEECDDIHSRDTIVPVHPLFARNDEDEPTIVADLSVVIEEVWSVLAEANPDDTEKVPVFDLAAARSRRSP